MESPSMDSDALNGITSPIDLSSLVQPVRFRGQQFSMLRLDLMSGWASGNKYFKLKPYVSAALESHTKLLVSKGGMFSNHLDALAKAGRHFDLEVICLIRSYQPDLNNPTIQQLLRNGAQVRFLQPDEYTSYDEGRAAAEFPQALFIPEGGLSKNGLTGSKELGESIASVDVDHIVLMGGTMCTALGILSAMPLSKTTHIIPAWKGCTPDYITQRIREYNISISATWHLWPDYHFGGFGKWDQRLLDFMIEFTSATSIPLDPVYTGKMAYAFADLLASTIAFDPSRTMLIHTGGLQGVEGYGYRFPEVWNKYATIIMNSSTEGG